MEQPRENEQVSTWENLMFLYNSALKKVQTKIEILNDEFQFTENYNPIEHIKSRIKTAESISKKLKKLGIEVTIENMNEYLHDIAGIRIICSFMSDIPKIAAKIAAQDDVTVVLIKDYLKYPKPNGYKSYHMVVQVPVYTATGPVQTKVEIQIRTIAMDFWASLEHKIYYKFEGGTPEDMQKELKECADMVSLLDQRMLALNESLKVPDERNKKC